MSYQSELVHFLTGNAFGVDDVTKQKHSMHTRGLAADILCPQFGMPLEVSRQIRPVGSCLRPGDSRIRPWCHVGFAEDGQERRNELLTLHSTAIGYELGLGYSTFRGPFLRQD